MEILHKIRPTTFIVSETELSIVWRRINRHIPAADYPCLLVKHVLEEIKEKAVV
jgi:hypothetical protein